MELKTLTYQSSSIFYRIIGKGKPVVLIHGFGEDGAIWNNQVEGLKDHFQLIIPDLPGSGKSAVISGQLAPDSYRVGIEDYAEVVRAILDEEKLAGSVMIGHSMGGYITLAFAEKYPGMVFSLGLVHSSAFADSNEKKQARSRSIEFIKNNGAHEFLKTSIPGLFKGHEGSKPPDPYIEDLIEKGKNFSLEALIQYYQAMIARPDRTAVLKTFNGPVLFIIGQHDNAVPFQQSLQQCYLPAISHIHILRNSAHMGMLEEPVATNNFLLQFLQ
jgi:pimeloyl-ACP methyl ester carboxylesterase